MGCKFVSLLPDCWLARSFLPFGYFCAHLAPFIRVYLTVSHRFYSHYWMAMIHSIPERQIPLRMSVTARQRGYLSAVCSRGTLSAFLPACVTPGDQWFFPYHVPQRAVSGVPQPHYEHRQSGVIEKVIIKLFRCSPASILGRCDWRYYYCCIPLVLLAMD